MPTKMVLYFNMFASGWSETYYSQEDDPQQLANLIDLKFYNAATQFRSTSCIMKAARFSAIGGARQSFLVRPSSTVQGKSGTTEDPGPDVASTDAVFLLQSTAGAQRRLFLRGLADQDVRRDVFGNDLLFGTLLKGTNAFFTQLFTYGFCIKKSQRPPNGGLIYRQINNVTVSANDPQNRTTLYYPTAGGFVPTAGSRVQFVGVPRSLPRFPRIATILRAHVGEATTDFDVAYSLPGGVAVVPPNLRVTGDSPILSRISLWSFERYSEHKTGRPFGSLRGRARVGR